MKDGANQAEAGARRDGERDSIKDLVMQEAAAAIMAAGRELTEGERLSVREFLRGPALKVGLALSVMGVTMWIAQMNAEHRAQKARRASAAQPPPRQRRARGSTGANG
jgi:hypothetical protein